MAIVGKNLKLTRKDSTADELLALHVVNLILILRNPYDSPELSMTPECRAKSKPRTSLDVMTPPPNLRPEFGAACKDSEWGFWSEVSLC